MPVVHTCGRAALVAAMMAASALVAAEPARAPMDWKSVHPEAIAAWKTANNAPDGVVFTSYVNRGLS